jgi:predicted XRE-type DNA-binding protein
MGQRISIGKEMHKLIELETRNDPDSSRLTVRLERKRNDTSHCRQKQLKERRGIAVDQEFIEQCDETYGDQEIVELLRTVCRQIGQTAVANALGVRQPRISKLLRSEKVDICYKAEIVALAQKHLTEREPDYLLEDEESEIRDNEREAEGFGQLGIPLTPQ